MSYQISSRDYLRRARAQLLSSNFDSLFYAALELRSGVEARLSEYVEVQENVSKKLKQGWRIAVLGKGIDRAFKIGDKLARFSYRDGGSGEELFVLYYTPVSKLLQQNAQKLGKYMHYQKQYRSDNDEWWNTFRSELGHTYKLLCQSCIGTMLGPPLMRNGNKFQTFVEVVEGCAVDLTEYLHSGNRLVAGISYPTRYPAQFESNAYIWRPDLDLCKPHSCQD